MTKLFLAALAAVVVVAQAPAFSQVTVLDGKYAEGNIIRVVSRVKMPAPPGSAYRVAMLKVATMAGQRGYSRIAVVKIDDCVSLGINNSLPIVQTCKIFGQMVAEGEVAQPKGREAVKYFILERTADGVYLPKPEAELEGTQKP